jgi:DNA primase
MLNVGKDIMDARNVKISDLLGLQNTGRRQHIRCPFHKDSTPSFVLYPDNSFHCYGCSAHGNNAIDFAKLVSPSDSFENVVKDLLAYRYPLS